MNSNDLNKRIKTCESKDFFQLLESLVECNVPLQLRNILTLNSCNSAVALSRNIFQTIDDIEFFMRNKFNKNMIRPSENLKDYLGIYVKQQKDFRILIGDRNTLCVIYEHCRKLYNVDDIRICANESPKQSQSTVSLNPTVPIQYSKDVPSTSFQSDVVPSTSCTSDVSSVAQIQQSNNVERVVSRHKSNSGEPVVSDHVKKMFNDLFTWMTKQDSLEEVLMFENVLFFS